MVLFPLMRIISLLYLHNLLFSVLISAPVSGVCNWRAGASQLSRLNGKKILFIYIQVEK